jgi:hypothetical protein
LETVSLLFRPRLGIDALDVLLRVGIGSFPHNLWPNERSVRATFPLCKLRIVNFSARN